MGGPRPTAPLLAPQTALASPLSRILQPCLRATVHRWSTFNPLVRQLAPGYLDWDVERFSKDSIQPNFLDLIWERQPNGEWLMVHESFAREDADITAAKYAAGLLSSRAELHNCPTPTPLPHRQPTPDLCPNAVVPEHSPNHLRLTYISARVYTWDGVAGSWDPPPYDPVAFPPPYKSPTF
jgi:hypothetical protein